MGDIRVEINTNIFELGRIKCSPSSKFQSCVMAKRFHEH